MPLFVPMAAGSVNAGVELDGTASVLEIDKESFILTATHVLQSADPNPLLYPTDGDVATALTGHRLMFQPGQDAYDIGVVRLDGPPPRSQVKRLKVEDLYLHDTPEDVLLVGCGFPYSRNKNKHRRQNFRNRCQSIEWPSLCHDDYRHVGLNPNHHVALDFDLKGRPNKLNVPKLVGMSGGPIWTGAGGRDQVIGVIQYHDTDSDLGKAIVHGTKVTLALAAVARAFPYLQAYIPVAPLPERLVKSSALR